MIPLLKPNTKLILPFSTIADDNNLYKIASIKVSSFRPSVKKKTDQAIATALHLKLGALVNSHVI